MPQAYYNDEILEPTPESKPVTVSEEEGQLYSFEGFKIESNTKVTLMPSTLIKPYG
jgi:hypothetical protein